MALKTSKSVAKRFQFTKNKKIKFHPAAKSHLLTKKESEKKRQLRRACFLTNKKDQKKIRRLLPYG